MQVPTEVSFRHIFKSPDLADLMEKECGNLDRFLDRIISCRVSLEKEQKSNAVSGLYRVKAEIALPGRHRIVVKKEAKTNGDFSELAKLVRETFNKVSLTLERLKGKQFGRFRSSRRQQESEA